MSSFEWDMSELNSLSYELGSVGFRVAGQAVQVVAKTAMAVAADGQLFAPVDTGNLRNSISADVRGLEAEIGPTAAYGAYVEFGTSRQAPAAYMGPALDRNGPAFEQAMGILAERAL